MDFPEFYYAVLGELLQQALRDLIKRRAAGDKGASLFSLADAKNEGVFPGQESPGGPAPGPEDEDEDFVKSSSMTRPSKVLGTNDISTTLASSWEDDGQQQQPADEEQSGKKIRYGIWRYGALKFLLDQLGPEEPASFDEREHWLRRCSKSQIKLLVLMDESPEGFLDAESEADLASTSCESAKSKKFPVGPFSTPADGGGERIRGGTKKSRNKKAMPVVKGGGDDAEEKRRREGVLAEKIDAVCRGVGRRSLSHVQFGCDVCSYQHPVARLVYLRNNPDRVALRFRRFLETGQCVTCMLGREEITLVADQESSLDPVEMQMPQIPAPGTSEDSSCGDWPWRFPRQLVLEVDNLEDNHLVRDGYVTDLGPVSSEAVQKMQERDVATPPGVSRRGPRRSTPGEFRHGSCLRFAGS